MDEREVETVSLDLCRRCLDGEGGECHTPGCALWMNRAPDVPIRDRVRDARGDDEDGRRCGAMPHLRGGCALEYGHEGDHHFPAARSPQDEENA